MSHKNRSFLGLMLVVALVLALPIAAQQQFPTMERGFQPEKLYEFGDVDSVNVFSGTLLINIPIGPSYALNGDASYGLQLSYNSKPWDIVAVGPYVHGNPSLRANAGMGWILGMGRFVGSDDPANVSFIDLYESPDGGDHRFDGLSPDASCTSNCPTYTSDGSNLRLRKVSANERQVDFPDGTIKKFLRNASNGWDLREIRSVRSTDVVTITPRTGSATGCSGETSRYWTIADSRGRTHKVCFTDLLVDAAVQPMVDRVIVVAPGGTATYQFHYKPTTMLKPLEDTDDRQEWRQEHEVQLLDSLTLPDGSQYQFTAAERDVVASMTLPTMGKVAYEFESWFVPSTTLCDHTYSPGFGFGSFARGVATRTFTPAVPIGQLPTSRAWTYSRALKPDGFDPDYMSRTTCWVPTVPNGDPVPLHVKMYDEMVVTITDPIGHQTKNHFSIWPGLDDGRVPDPDASPAGFKREHYGFPYGRYDAAQDRHLSQEMFECDGACVLKRSMWVRQETQPSILSDPPYPSRLASQRTVYHDDPAGCVGEGPGIDCARSTIDRSDWDGYGHYRKTTKNLRFDDDGSEAPTRTVVTDWNKSQGIARTIPPDLNWVLNTYEATTTTENNVTAIEQSCFDLQTGFLRGSRTLVGATPGETDLIVKYDLGGDANVSLERYFGGDLEPVTANEPYLCAALDTLGTTLPKYRVNHLWQHGQLQKSGYGGLTFFFRDLTIDLSGVVTASRDAAGLVTAYGYDSSRRLTSVTAPGMAPVSYQYANASGTGVMLTQPAKVTETTVSGTAGTVKREFQFDSFGRLWRQKKLMPNGHWSLQETLYDKLDRPASVSETVSLQGVANEWSFTPPHKTTYAYDIFGRPVLTTAPDGTSVTTTYGGVRASTRVANLATGASQETPVGRREEYDGLNRLTTVVENADLDPSNGIQGEVITRYTYDVGNRLKTVAMTGAAGVQNRSFTYDKRGLLQQEQHPELGVNGNGTAVYSNYDAHGNVGRKTVGASVDVRYEYDAADRLIRTRDGAMNRDLALFAWDCLRADVTQACAGTPVDAGRLVADARYNYDSALGAVTVTQSHQYDPATGLLVRRDSAVGDGVVGGVTRFKGEAFFFTQTANDLGMPSTLTYPCRNGGAGCLAGDPGRSIAYGYSGGLPYSIGTYASVMTWRPNGTLDTVTHGAGPSAVLEKWAADSNGMPRPQRIYATNTSGTELWSTGEYAFDAWGNIKTIGNTSYWYDRQERLKGWSWVSEGSQEGHLRGYDAFGNLTSIGMFMSRDASRNHEPVATSSVSLVVVGTTNHYDGTIYDAAGNVTRGLEQDAYTWDPLSMMTSATVGGRTFRYLYAASDERIAAVERVPVSSQLRNRTTFTLRGASNQLLSTWTDDWTSGSRVFTRKEDSIWRGSQLLARAYGSSIMHYTLDHLGSPRLISDGSGAVLDVQDFDPFGSGGLFGSGALQFTGHERDRANLGGGTYELPDYMHARYYEGWGRFLSIDPVSGVPGQPQSWNRYTYLHNNPLNLVDRTGLCGEDPDFIGPTVPCDIGFSMEIDVAASSPSLWEHGLWYTSETTAEMTPFGPAPFMPSDPWRMWEMYQARQNLAPTTMKIGIVYFGGNTTGPGQVRASVHGGNWGNASLSETVANVVGENHTITQTAQKTVYANQQTGMRVVYDRAGNYFRVQNGQGQYVDQFGTPIPNNVALVNSNAKWIGVPKWLRKALTHFRNTD